MWSESLWGRHAECGPDASRHLERAELLGVVLNCHSGWAGRPGRGRRDSPLPGGGGITQHKRLKLTPSQRRRIGGGSCPRFPWATAVVRVAASPASCPSPGKDVQVPHGQRVLPALLRHKEAQRFLCRNDRGTTRPCLPVSACLVASGSLSNCAPPSNADNGGGTPLWSSKLGGEGVAGSRLPGC